MRVSVTRERTSRDLTVRALYRMHAYEDDFFDWAQEQAALLRAGDFPGVDLENVASQLEALARSLKQELTVRFARLQQSLLQWEYLEGARLMAWSITVEEERSAIPLLLERAPVLSVFVDDKFANAWSLARNRIIICTGLNERLVPETCPYSVEQALDWRFWPGQSDDTARGGPSAPRAE